MSTMWIALLIKPLALAAAVAGLVAVRRAVQRLPDSRMKRFLLWPGEVRGGPSAGQPDPRRKRPQ